MCSERERLIDYVYDECGAEERRLMEKHLEKCDACREEVAGLGRVRQDLLAWVVPDHGSVWQPFAPPKVVPWWREVPAWAMAAAASVMFVMGAAGGVVTHALAPHPDETPIAVMPVAAGLSAMDLELAEARILNTVRAEVGARVELATAHVQPVAAAVDFAGAEDRALKQMRSILNADKADRLAWFSTVNTELNRADGRMDSLDRDVRSIFEILENLQGR
jgi:anti-sigma factor RsiW